MKKKRIMTNKENSSTKSKTLVHHWRFEDGVARSIVEGRGRARRLDSPERGWYCWVYPESDKIFTDWMEKHCPSAECIHRFNSGDPMYTVYIKEDKEATLFTMKWIS